MCLYLSVQLTTESDGPNISTKMKSGVGDNAEVVDLNQFNLHKNDTVCI